MSKTDLSAVLNDDFGPAADDSIPSVDDADGLDEYLAAVLDDEHVAEVLADRPGLDLRPAIRALSAPQLRLFAEFVDGFEDRESLLKWGARALIHTLGELDPNWIASSLTSRSDLSVLVDGYPAPGREDTLDDEKATRIRVALASLDLLPAFRAAKRRLRFDVKEWVPGEWSGGVPDGEDQKHPGMLPALTELEGRFVWALDELLSGFGSPSAFAVWHQEVVEGTFVELDDSLIDAALVSEPALQKYVIVEPTDVENGREIRMTIALDELLPAFADAVDSRVVAAREFVAENSEKDTNPGL